MALSEDEQSRLDALEQSLLVEDGDHSHMPEVERTARRDSHEADLFAVFAGRATAAAPPLDEDAPPTGARPLDGPSARPTGRRSRAGRLVVGLLVVAVAIGLYALAAWARLPWVGVGGFALLVIAAALWMRMPGNSSRSSWGEHRQAPARPDPGAPRGLLGRDPFGRDRPGSVWDGGRRVTGSRVDGLPGRAGGSVVSGRAGTPGRARATQGSFMQRLERRWDARRDERGR
ncbi:hypothetical protein CYJ76_06415 [Kytococcus schroeteri]|uniref:DUF3040 domain-containing protein n=2 Tax=Kytococcus schroeteri TaxID=138300 RepID=A0A2I1PAS6_9MICO|nr:MULTISPECIES: hypothetical protein [Kytococcus]OFS16048.1 hypothetical protein HMPREF3099_00430 [Kytococcus sp. HMSC28H12]PKZ41691.1 hypothetical protein CYJ76_06415 [Kytococcus schroeteri]